MMFDPIFNSFKIRYTCLDELIESNDINLKKQVNCYINLDCIFKELCTRNVDETIRSGSLFKENNLDMVANIINLAAHYRRYFMKHNIYSKIILMCTYPFNRKKFKNCVYNKNYKKNFIDKLNSPDNTMVLKILEESISLAKIICEYIDGLYLINSNEVEISMIPKIFTTDIDTKECHNIIVTKDKYDYQYCNDDYIIFRPKKEDPYLVTKDNLLKVMKSEYNISNEKDIDTSFYVFMYCLLGDTSRNIEKIKRIGLSSLINKINTGINEGLVGQTNNSIYVLANLVKTEYRHLLLSNHYLVDVKTQYNNLNINDKYNISSQFVDKFDNDALIQINNKYFADNPINIVDLVNASIIKDCYMGNKTIFHKR